MSIVNKIFREEVPFTDNHAFAAIVRLWVSGKITGPMGISGVEAMLTKNNGGVPYSLTSAELTQMTAMQTHYDNLPDTDTKQTWFSNFEGTLVLAEHGEDVLISKNLFLSLNGLN